MMICENCGQPDEHTYHECQVNFLCDEIGCWNEAISHNMPLEYSSWHVGGKHDDYLILCPEHNEELQS